jgi:hypothetical protein
MSLVVAFLPYPSTWALVLFSGTYDCTVSCYDTHLAPPHVLAPLTACICRTSLAQAVPSRLTLYLCSGPPALLDGLGTPSNELKKPLFKLLFPTFCRCNKDDVWYDGPTFTLLIRG